MMSDDNLHIVQNSSRKKLQNSKPFVKLFRTPRKFYFYDVNKDTICDVDEGTYYEIDMLLNDNNYDVSEQVMNLYDEGWLSEHRPDNLRHELTDKVELWARHEVSQLILQVTQSCNLSCIYCPYANNTDNTYSRSHTGKMMSFETAKKAIDFVCENSDNAEDIFISFYGGEPLIAFPLIKKCVKYAQELFDGKNIQFLITTNATLLTDEMIEFFAVNKFLLTFSVDGPKKIHDKHRVCINGQKTYDLVMDNLRRTIEKYGVDNLSRILINMVINPSDSLDEIVEWFEEPLLKNIAIQTALVEDDYLENKFEMTSEFTEKLQYRLAVSMLGYFELVSDVHMDRITEAMVKRIAESYSKLQNVGGGLPDETCPGGPCLSGVKKLFVNTDGKFFPCEKVNEMSECMLIGDINVGFDFEKIREHLNIANLTPDSCKNCWAQLYCSTCQRRADDGSHLSGMKKNTYCKQVKDELITTLRTCALIKEIKTMYKLPEIRKFQV